jgi:hypothetical protein
MFETFEACTPNNIWMLKSNLNNTSNSCNLGSKSMAKETTLVEWERTHQHKDTNTNQNYNHNSGCNNTQHLDQVLQLRSCHEQLQVLQIIPFNHAYNDKDGTKIFYIPQWKKIKWERFKRERKYQKVGALGRKNQLFWGTLRFW